MNVLLDSHKTSLGDIVTISKDGNAVARLRQIGKKNPDVRLEWLNWENHKQKETAIQFPCCSLADITIRDAENMIAKYNL